MIRLTIMYNLPEDADETEFLSWRLGKHQVDNASMPGVIRTDFARIDETHPRDASAPYRFMTIAEWPDRESFENSFYTPESQAKFQEDLKKIRDPLLLISEILTGTHNDLS